MGYEVHKPNQNHEHEKIGNLDSIRAEVIAEIAEARKYYGVGEETKIYKKDGVWRFATAPFQLLDEWKKEKDEYEKARDDLYKDDPKDRDTYHQK